MKNIVYNCPEEQVYTLQMNFKAMVPMYGVAIAKKAEQLIRLETAHFTSKLWRVYKNAGMQAANIEYPFGWGSMQKLWDMNKQLAPVNCKPLRENKQKDIKGSGKIQMFIIFDSFYIQILSVCEFLKQHDNDAGDWFALKETDQLAYEAKIKSIRARFV